MSLVLILYIYLVLKMKIECIYNLVHLYDSAYQVGSATSTTNPPKNQNLHKKTNIWDIDFS